MKQFAAGVITTVTAGVLLAWVIDSVPNLESATEALSGTMRASTEVAERASTIALGLACLCALGALAYWTWSAVELVARGAVDGLGVGGPATGATATFALAYMGLRSWAETSIVAVPILLAAAAVGAWTVSTARRRWTSVFRVA